MSKWLVARVRVPDDTVKVGDDDATRLIKQGVERGTAQYFVEEEDDPTEHPIDCTCIFCIPGA